MHISRTSSRLSLCACAVTSSISWEATDAILWNLCYVYVCSCVLNMFKTIEEAADCEIQSVIRFLNARNVLPSEFVTRSVKCMVTMRWVIAWLGNGFGCSMKDERTCTMRREVGVHLWWVMIWCLKSTKKCVATDISQFMICPCTFLRFQGLYSMTSSVVLTSQAAAFHEEGIQKLVPRYNKCLNNGCKYVENSLKNVECDNNKILYETLIDFFTAKRY